MVSNEPFVQNAITLTGVTVTNKQPAAIQTVSGATHLSEKEAVLVELEKRSVMLMRGKALRNR